MIQIRPGRSWRHNPTYASELSSLGVAGVRAFDGTRILDVLGVEVDGVDIAAGVGEAPLCSTVDELVRAMLLLGRGAVAAQVTVGPGPTTMILEPRGPDVLLTLLSLRSPSRVLAGGLLVDGLRLRQAALGAAQRVLVDLLDVCPALRGAPWVRRLTRDLGLLARVRPLAPPVWPPENLRQGIVARSARGPIRLEVHLPGASVARLAARVQAITAPLAPLIGPGTLVLRFAGKGSTSFAKKPAPPALSPTLSPALSIDAAPYLALRDLLRSAEELIQAFESGEQLFLLRFGSLELRCDLTRDELRAEGLRDPVHAPPLALAEAFATAGLAFSRRAMKLAGQAPSRRALGKRRPAAWRNPHPDDPLDELYAIATELLAHCRDLASGDLQRAPEAVRAPPLPLPASEPVTARIEGRVRRLVHRLAFEISAGPIVEGGLHVFPESNACVLQGTAGLTAIDLATSARLWHRAGTSPAPSALALAGTSELFVLHDDALLRIDASNGEVRFRRLVRGAGLSLFPLGGGCAVSLAGGGLAMVRDDGALAFRTRLPEEPKVALAGDGIILAQLPGGQLAGLDAREGVELWRRRIGVKAGPPILCGSQILSSAEDARGAQRIVSLQLASGETIWERALPPVREQEHGPGALVLFGDLCATLAGRGLVVCRTSDGAIAFSRELSWGPIGRLCGLEQGLLALGPGASALLLDERGQQIWSRPALSATQAPPLAPLQSGPALLLGGDAVELVETVSGHSLSRPSMADTDAAALLADLGVLLHLRDGTLALLRLATHLSLV